MAKRDDKPENRPASEAAGPPVFVLCARDESLRRAWEKIEPPEGFRLASAASPAEALASPDAVLVIVDAAEDDSSADSGEGPAGAAERGVWAGTARAIERLGPERIERAYDVLVTPTTPAALGRRLQGWARNVQRTAALEEMGRRVEQLAEQSERAAARAAEAETQSEVLVRQRERLDQALGQIRRVTRLSREINSLDLDRIVRVCTERLPGLIGVKRSSLYFYDAADDRLILQGHSHGYPIAKRVDLKENARSPMAVAVRRGRLLLIGEFHEFERAEDLVLEREFREQYATASCVVVPLKAGDRVLGVLNLADKVDGEPFDEDIDLPVVEQIAELIGASIYNVELYQEMERRAKTDPLTELANRRALEEALARETDRCRRYGSRLSALMIDVDGLKTVNDEYGHEAGDQVLKNLAAVVVETVRSVDVPGRWAGDEFLVVLPDTSASQAKRLAKRLMKRIKAQPAKMGETVLESSLSVGVAEYAKDESVDALLRRVDAAMYEAKQAGRSRIASAPARKQK
ncbi:MAG: sensor domain-containing diguanylate cyclase [Phycisphaerae bacterium]